MLKMHFNSVKTSVLFIRDKLLTLVSKWKKNMFIHYCLCFTYHSPPFLFPHFIPIFFATNAVDWAEFVL